MLIAPIKPTMPFTLSLAIFTFSYNPFIYIVSSILCYLNLSQSYAMFSLWELVCSTLHSNFYTSLSHFTNFSYFCTIFNSCSLKFSIFTNNCYSTLSFSSFNCLNYSYVLPNYALNSISFLSSSPSLKFYVLFYSLLSWSISNLILLNYPYKSSITYLFRSILLFAFIISSFLFSFYNSNLFTFLLNSSTSYYPLSLSFVNY